MGTDEKSMLAIKKIVGYEDNTPASEWSLGWSWNDVGVYPGTIGSLIVQGLVEMTYKSHAFTHYKLTEEGRLLAVADGPIAESPVAGPQLEVLPEVPGDLFDDIVGYDNIKELLLSSLSIQKPVHVLLYGPPALAKTMFLRVIDQLGGQLSVWITGSAASQAGLWDMLAERKPRWLLIDEVEKMNLPDVAGLLSLMETGRLVRTKVGRTLDEQLTVWVIAAANRISKLPPELLSRFAIVSVEEYGMLEFVQVVKKVLIRWEDTDEVTADRIANELVGKTHDVRDAVRVARLSSRVGVDRAIELLLKR